MEKEQELEKKIESLSKLLDNILPYIHDDPQRKYEYKDLLIALDCDLPKLLWDIEFSILSDFDLPYKSYTTIYEKYGWYKLGFEK